MLTGMSEGHIFEGLQVGYDVARERAEPPLIILVEETNVDKYPAENEGLAADEEYRSSHPL